MNSPTSGQKPNNPRDKRFLKRLRAKNRRLDLKVKNTKRLRIFQTVQAGHVRGGHSFH